MIHSSPAPQRDRRQVIGSSSHPRANRAITVLFGEQPDLPGLPEFQFVRLTGREALSELFRYEVELRPLDSLASRGLASFDSDRMIGHEMTVQIELEDLGVEPGLGTGRYREITGIICAIDCLHAAEENDIVRFTLRPWLWLGSLRTDFKSFQNMTVIEILDEVLARYPFQTEKRLGEETYPKRIWEVQHGESDAHFVQRLTEEYGISYFFAHEEGRHRLVLTSTPGAFRPLASVAYRTLSLGQDGSPIECLCLSRFESMRQVHSGRIALSDYDFCQPRADLFTASHQPRNTGFSEFEQYEFPGSYIEREDGEWRARIRMEQQRTLGHRSRGVAALRGMVTGCTFTIDGFGDDSNGSEYLIVSAEFFLEDRGSVSGLDQRFQSRVEFIAHSCEEIFRPSRTAHLPRTMGPQTAVVTGPAGQEIWCDAFGRVKVQFHWDRYGKHDEHSSPWIRVVGNWRGDRFGASHVPRIGQEVIVDFLDGDPDCPVIVGSVANACNMPPWTLADQQALSGYRSKELSGEGRNHILHDDTHGQQQLQLFAEYGASQLVLGHNVRIADAAGRKDKRGEGFELRTDSWGVLRAALGMLVTSYGSRKAQGPALQADEMAGLLKLAGNTAKVLSEAACDAAIQFRQWREVILALGHQLDGMCAGSALGEFAAPYIAVTSPAGIAATTPRTIQIASGEHMALTAEGHVTISSRRGFMASVLDRIGLVARAGIGLFAARGHAEIQAQDGELRLAARHAVNVASTDDWVRITARKGIELSVEGTTIRITAEGIENATAGKWTAYAGSHAMPGPKQIFALLPELPGTRDVYGQSPFSH